MKWNERQKKNLAHTQRVERNTFIVDEKKLRQQNIQCERILRLAHEIVFDIIGLVCWSSLVRLSVGRTTIEYGQKSTKKNSKFNLPKAG